jgi:alkaline phosphatase D
MFAAARISLLLVLSFLTGFHPSLSSADTPLERIAFGSCARQHQPQPIWDSIIKIQPQLFLFLGDNIYADTEDMTVMRAQYAVLAAKPEFQRFRSACPILATWDDHDYGYNDAGGEYPRKVESQRIFLEFFQIPKKSPRWQRPGVYEAQVFGPPGKRVQTILLDTRYFRGPLNRRSWLERLTGGGPYTANPDPQVNLLGADQWAWLEQELRKPAELRLIGSSIQVIPEDHHWERWANLPHERTRLFQLIHTTQAGGVILLSGDRHLAELSRLDPNPDNPLAYPLYEATSSGLNSAGAGKGELNRHRLTKENFREDNFGLITIDWTDPDPKIQLQIRNLQGEIAQEHAFHLSQIQP